MNVLALDFATKTGWALKSGGSGVWDFTLKADESSGFRLIRFRQKLKESLDSYGYRVVVFEQVSVARGKKSNANSFKLQSKMQGILEVFCHDNGIEHCSYNLKQIKAHAVKGNASKQEMVDAAKSKWPKVKIVDDNQADALWLLDLYLSEYN